MKKIFFYALCLQFIAVTGCNDNGKGKDSVSDTTTVTAKEGVNTDQMKAFFAGPLPGFNPDSTIQNLSKYPDLFTKTKTVRFNYNRVSTFIDSLDQKFGTPATGIYLFYGAYTPAAVSWYLKNHSNLSAGDSLMILNKPCLVIAYKDPTNNQFIYSTDMGTICPPPNSCESFERYTGSGSANTKGYDPGTTVANYDAQYEEGKNPIYPLTQRVKFDIVAMRYLVDSLNRAGSSTSDIYFAMGAYTNSDAQRYVQTHPSKPPITAGEIQNRTCLLLAFKNLTPKAVAQFTYYDFGTICPPPNSCETPFVYTR